jgi:hypothetical protein
LTTVLARLLPSIPNISPKIEFRAIIEFGISKNTPPIKYFETRIAIRPV